MLTKDFPKTPCALLLGGFDGFHRGHARLLERANKLGLPVGLTTFFGGKGGGELFTAEERETIFSRLGFAFCLCEELTERFRRTPYKEFLDGLFARLNLRLIVCGEDFRFGRDALGTPSLLQALAPCPVEVVPIERAAGEKISSSRLKELVKAGRVEELNDLLVGGYFTEGAVERGRSVGKTLGFPTVNLSFGKGKLPLGEGVYAGRAETERGEYPAVVNVGARPTFGVEEKKIEAHLVGFSGDLYDSRVRVFFGRYLRPVQAFPTREALICQLQRDIESTKEKV